MPAEATLSGLLPTPTLTPLKGALKGYHKGSLQGALTGSLQGSLSGASGTLQWLITLVLSYTVCRGLNDWNRVLSLL